MTDPGVTAGKHWKIGVGLALLFVAVLVAWASFAGGERADGDASEDGPFRAVEANGHQPASDLNHRSPGQEGLSATRAGSRDDAGGTPKGTIIRQKLPKPDAGDAGPSANPQGADQSSNQWRDPANRKMLGQRQWMATTPDAESQAIDQAFDEPPPQRYPIDLEERRQGVELAKGVVEDCFDSYRARVPQATGRISVAFDLEANGKNARFTNVEIPANVDLDDPEFEGCITRGLSQVSFRSGEQGTMRVEYPFLFDGADQR